MTIPLEVTYSLQGRGLKLNSREDVKEYVQAIKIQQVRKLVLSGNTIGVEAAEALAEAIQEKDELEYVDLSDTFTGRLKDEIPKALTFFCDALRDKKHIKYLNLNDNALAPVGASIVASYLSTAYSLKILSMNNNGLGSLGGKSVAEALVNLSMNRKTFGPELSHVSKPGLEVIIMGRNRLENEGIQELSKAIECNSETLFEVLLPQNGIRASGITTLCSSLAKCHHLKSIDLQDNTFTLEGCQAFSKAMKYWTHIQSINLNDAYLTAKGASVIFQCLQEHPRSTLEYLLLQYNGIKNGELAKLITAIPHLPNLVSLHLNGNAFDASSEITNTLTETLDRCSKIDVLDSLSDMECDDDSDEEEEEEDEQEETEVIEQQKLIPIETPALVINVLEGLSPEKEEEFEKLADMMASVNVDDNTPSISD